MKNIIPLIVSVILGLAAVFIVSKMLVNQDISKKQSMVSIAVAARNIAANDELTQGMLTYKSIPSSIVPKNALLWENVNLAYGQKLPHDVSADEFIMMNDIREQSTLSESCRPGEWTIPVTFSDPALVKMLIPGDEIAIVSTQAVRKLSVAPGSDETNRKTVVHTDQKVTSVLLPCVRVLGMANANGSFREPSGSTATIFVSLPPQQAMIVLAAQRESELYPVLRKKNDSSALNRKDGGMVTTSTLEKLQKNIPVAELPFVPNRDHR
ncbi:MAG: Flp pilus assembly protein CpaB [Lentisphaeria bacterium]|nr:Flp pilus assembly protein CpaB [Lentisphaeria bacterium]